MKLPLGRPRKRAEEKTVLFVGVENAGRSQMAEALFRKYASRCYLATSAGTMPAGEINPEAIQVMKEVVLILANKSRR
jgi:arsenate reductase (thioredoxin)